MRTNICRVLLLIVLLMLFVLFVLLMLLMLLVLFMVLNAYLFLTGKLSCFQYGLGIGEVERNLVLVAFSFSLLN